MSDFAPGDLVVCVHDGNIPCRGGLGVHGGGPGIRMGRVGRVVSLLGPNCFSDCPALLLDDGTEGLSARFRKIDKSDEGFAAWMRSMRPAKQPAREHAHTPSGNPS